MNRFFIRLMALVFVAVFSTPADAHLSTALSAAPVRGGSFLPAADPAPAPPPANGNNSATSAKDVNTTTPALPADTDIIDIEPPQETFGTKALTWVIGDLDRLRAQGRVFIDNFSALPEMISWFERQNLDAKYQSRWNSITNDLFFTVGIPLVAAIAFEFLLLPLRNNMRRRRPERFAPRLGAVLGLVGLKLLPVVLFLGASLVLLDQNEQERIPRLVILNVIYALALGRIAMAVIRGMLSPRIAALRLIPAANSQAIYAHRKLRAFSLVIIYGYFFIDIARLLHVPDAAITTFGNLLGLALVLMTLTVIMQKRSFIANRLRGKLSATQPDLSLFDSLRLWFAHYWHILAAAYLIIGYGIAALGVRDGFALMLRGTILTLLILVAMRLLFHVSDRWGASDTGAAAVVHHTILRFMLRLVTWVFAALGVAAAWGANIPALFATPLGQRVLGAALSIGATIIVIVLIYEGCNAAIEKRLYRRDADGKVVPASARVRTLLPMIRNIVFVVFSVIVALVVLSEAGINIAPLLAGAGVVGVAVGFGSQTLVKDFLTGLFIILENTVAVGDRIKIGDYSGIVESISLRTVRLRDWDGALHILPFSEVTKITNLTRDFAFAQISVGVSYDSDLEHVMKIMRSVAEDLQEEWQKNPTFKRAILEPIEIQGVDNLGDYSITIVARLRTRPGKQWDVRRMYLLRLKQRFDKEGIQIPFPTATRIHMGKGED